MKAIKPGNFCCLDSFIECASLVENTEELNYVRSSAKLEVGTLFFLLFVNRSLG